MWAEAKGGGGPEGVVLTRMFIQKFTQDMRMVFFRLLRSYVSRSRLGSYGGQMSASQGGLTQPGVNFSVSCPPSPLLASCVGTASSVAGRGRG